MDMGQRMGYGNGTRVQGQRMGDFMGHVIRHGMWDNQ